MKLRDKKTGEIRTAYVQVVLENNHPEKPLEFHTQSSIAELNEEWEDYEEPEGWWFIDRAYEPHATNSTLRNLEADREIGNYFNTKEEAEKAVEKLKAWKRLKDKGFRFNTWYGGSKNISYEITSLENEAYIPREIGNDLDLLFGGEE